VTGSVLRFACRLERRAAVLVDFFAAMEAFGQLPWARPRSGGQVGPPALTPASRISLVKRSTSPLSRTSVSAAMN
jgi:hypothetical protein